MEIRLPVPEGYVAEIISDGLIAIRPVESEDERTRKELLEVIRHCYEDGGYTLCTDDYKKYSDYLEKQKDSPMPEDTVVFQKGVAEGRRLEREDMEKKRGPIIETYQRSWYTEGYYDGKLKKEPRWIIKNQGICTKYEENPKYGQSLEEEQKPLPGFDDLTPDEKMNHPLYLEGFDAGREVGRVEAEQKPEWSEEDEKMVETICKEGDLKPSEQRWLKSLKNRGNSPQSNTNSPSWSEEDEKKINAIVGVLDYQATLCQKRIAAVDGFMLDELIDWLKFLRPSWKPSEEQMRQLGYVAEQNKHNMLGKELMTLYNDLKKLM